MPRKKSIRRSARRFLREIQDTREFIGNVSAQMSKSHASWVHEYALLRLYREFERLILECLVGAINNDTDTITSRTGIEFPRHMTDEVCEYLIIGDGYLDFRGRDGLIATLKNFLPDDHYLVGAVSRQRYKQGLERLSALRNFSAHSSAVAKRRAKEAVGAERIGSAGAWLKSQHRIHTLLVSMAELATEVRIHAPY